MRPILFFVFGPTNDLEAKGVGTVVGLELRAIFVFVAPMRPSRCGQARPNLGLARISLIKLLVCRRACRVVERSKSASDPSRGRYLAHQRSACMQAHILVEPCCIAKTDAELEVAPRQRGNRVRKLAPRELRGKASHAFFYQPLGQVVTLARRALGAVENEKTSSKGGLTFFLVKALASADRSTRQLST